MDQAEPTSLAAIDKLELRNAHRVAHGARHILEMVETMSGIGHWRLDLITGRSSWSAATYAIYGVDPETFEPGLKGILDLCDAKDRDRLRSAVIAATASGGGLELEFQLHRPDGESRHVISKAVCELDERGKPCAIVGVTQDVTDRVRSLQASREREAQYRRLAEDMAEQARIANEQTRRVELAEQVAGLGHWRLDAKTRAVSWSPQMYAIYGLDPAAPLDIAELMAMTDAEERQERAEQLERLFATGESAPQQVTRIRRADGQMRYLRSKSAAEFGADGSVVAAIGTVSDITEVQLNALAIEQSEARYRLLADNASDLVLQCMLNGRVTYVSPSALRMTGYTPDELIGRRWGDLMAPEDARRARSAIAEQAASGAVNSSDSVEYRFAHRDGRERWFEGRPTLVLDAETGRVTGFTSMVRDVSQQKATQTELQRALAEAEAAAAAKSEFLANMSHELRTPLTAVLGFSRLIGEQPELSPTARGYLDRVSGAGHALLTTVNDILDFSKLEAGQVEIRPRPVPPARLARETLDLLAVQAADKDIGLEAAGLEPLPAWVELDADRVRQVLLNLIGNAVKFTEAGGVRLVCAFDPADERLTFSVCDSGPGIAEDGVTRLFQRFSQVDGSSTRRHGGTGLGLAICKGLVEAMGGQIGVESQLGVGSRFWFSIPAPLAESLAPEAQIAGGAVGLLPGCRVLIADDKRVNRALVRAVLTPFEVELTEACDGNEAIDAAMSTPFDVILMDLRMPNLDGADAARRIRREDGPNDATPIIAFSADVTSELAAGLFNGAVAKPLSAAALIEAIGRVLEPDGDESARAPFRAEKTEPDSVTNCVKSTRAQAPGAQADLSLS